MKIHRVCWSLFILWLIACDLSAAPTKDFIIFDSTLYQNKPDLSEYGIKPIDLYYQSRFWKKGRSLEKLPSTDQIKKIAGKAMEKNTIAVLDIEHWKLNGSAQEANESIKKYTTVINQFRNYAPGIKLGYYGLPPIREYYRSLKEENTAAYKSWQSQNDRLLPLAKSLDIAFPSLYTFKNKPAVWKRYAIAQLKEARRILPSKPVYAFLWPQFHNSNKQLKNQYIPGDFWKKQLETVRLHADGVVIWGGWRNGGPAVWNNQAEWWTKTLEFISEHKE